MSGPREAERMSSVAEDYRTRAAECRALAQKSGITEEERKELLKMAAEWDAMAADREKGTRRNRP